MRKLNTIVYLALISIIIFLVITPVLAIKPPSKTIVISNEKDLYKLSENCSFDIWSQDKEIILDADINLKNKKFTPIPTFGGTFDGKGHTISGLSIKVEGSNQGLFRYLQEEGKIKNLQVEGSVVPKGDRSNIGGIVGHNNGVLENCSYSGYVKGKDTIGGLVGWNGISGMIINSSFNGIIFGKNKIGGIVGYNAGTVLRSSNDSNVNTTVEEEKFEYQDLTLEDMNIKRLISDSMDIGGIAGINTGIIKNTTSKGTVGHPSTGYNVGGIAGRQSGFISECVNYSTIYGRKEVAGIAGQMEPYVDKVIPPSKLEKLKKEMDILDSSIAKMIHDTKTTSNLMTQDFSTVQKNIDNSKTHIQSLVNQTESFINKDIEEINKINIIAIEIIDDLIPIKDSFTQTMEIMSTSIDPFKKAMLYFSNAMDGMSEFANEYKILSDILDNSNIEMELANDKLEEANKNFMKAMELLEKLLNQSDLVDSLNKFQNGDMSIDELLELFDFDNVDFEYLIEIFKEFQNGEINMAKLLELLEKFQNEELINLLNSIINNLNEAGEHLKNLMEEFEDADVHISNMIENMGSLSKDMKIGLDNMVMVIDVIEEAREDLKNTSKGIDNLLKHVSELPNLEFQTTDDVYQKTKDDLFSSIGDISKSLSIFISDVNEQGDTLMDNMQTISNQLFKIMDLVFDIVSDLSSGEVDIEKMVEDVSTDNIDEYTEGKVSDCENFGTIEGDINVGGIAGAMSFEFEFDPEEDLKLQSKLPYNTVYQTRAIITGSKNIGDVISKKDNAGGIVGNQDLGYIKDCFGMGSIESKDGNFVGGIAGVSESPIAHSYTKCKLKGGNNIGGIAGFGKNITNCYTLVDINKAKACVGAIAGNTDENSRIKKNYFVSDVLRGIDGISYGDKAEPISYEKLISRENIPHEFKEFELTFWAEDKLVKSIDFNYGDSILDIELPKIPSKEGYYGKWEEFSTEDLTFNTKIQAKYIPYVTILESDEKRDDILSIVLVEGKFTEEDFLLLNEEEVVSIGKKESLESWNLYIPEDEEITHKIRYYPPKKEKGLAIYNLVDGKWKKVRFKWDGKYMVFKAEGNSVRFALTHGNINMNLIIFLIILVLFIIVIMFVLKTKKKRN